MLRMQTEVKMKRSFSYAVLVLLGAVLSAPVFAQPYPHLRTELETLVSNASAQGVRMSIGVHDLTAGADTLLVGSQQSYPPASTIKMLLIATLMQQVDAGQLDLDDSVAVEADDIVGGMGVLQNEASPQQVSLRRLAELTITVSDNTATNVLVDVVGYQAMAALAAQLGFDTMQFGRKMFEVAQPPEKDNYIDARESLQLLAEIYNGSFLSRESREQILAWMSAQTVKTKIGAGIAADIPVAHKTGENGPVSHDMGYLLMPGSETALVIFTETANTTNFQAAQAELNPLVAQVAQIIYQAVRSRAAEASAAREP